ncbi:MAG: hypothetical protein ABIH66_09655 [bacterium]
MEELLKIPAKGYSALDAGGPRNRRWMIHENLPEISEADALHHMNTLHGK